MLALEAAFDSPTVQDGHQIAFGRIRVRYDDAVPGATYEVVHPYGVLRATADDTGRLFYTDDNGCMSSPCGTFDRLRTQPVGPVLRWDSGAPEGYVGDPTVEHRVVGSPYGTNEFTVRQVTDGRGAPITPVLVGSTDLFTVQGKIAGGADAPPAANGVTLVQATPGAIDVGGTAVVQGVLTPGGQPLGGATVLLQALPADAPLAGATWADVGTTRTMTNGAFAFRMSPTATTRYRAVFAGDEINPGVVSPVLTVGVRAVVTLARRPRRYAVAPAPRSGARSARRRRAGRSSSGWRDRVVGSTGSWRRWTLPAGGRCRGGRRV